MEEKQRQLPNDQDVLERLMQKIEERSMGITNNDKIKINGKAIGIFNYKRNKKEKMNKLYYITWYIDNIEYKYIYASDGDGIAKVLPDGNIELDDNIELKKENLEKQIQLVGEVEKIRNIEDNNGTSQAGEGRDLATKEHERNNEGENIEKQKNNTKNTQNIEKTNSQEKKLPNLKGKVEIFNNMMIPLYEIINGHYLWQILQLEEKLEDKLPEGLSAKDFRTGFLCIVDSKELNALDGKEREDENTLAIRTFSGDLIELDEKILKKMPRRSLGERHHSAQNTLREADGEEVGKPRSSVSSELTDMQLYEIPGVKDKFSVKEQWFLEINQNKQWTEAGGNRPSSGNTKEIYFVQQSLDETVYEREYNPTHTIKCKLEPTNEAPLRTNEEIKQQEELRNKSSDETLISRAQHYNNIVDECFKKYEDLGNYYNRTDIEKKIEYYHKNMSDEEVIEQIGEDLEFAKDTEHEIGNRRRN